MPELPDIEAYLAALQPRIGGQVIQGLHITSPFLVRTVDPPIGSAQGATVTGFRRIGKRIVIELDADRFLVIHLMIAGRLRWQDAGRGTTRRVTTKKQGRVRPVARIGLALLEFPTGFLHLTEAGTKRRASIYFVQGKAALAAHDPGGIEPLNCTAVAFLETLRRENHTLKRALTDPRLFAGIGNAYSDEILHAAGLSPILLTRKITDADAHRLFEASNTVLRKWTDDLSARFIAKFPGPGDVTAFRVGFSVHGRFGQSCPTCRTPVQRIRYAENETNYCPRCQTGGRILADRSLSRLLRDDWPRTVDELEGL